MGGLFSFVIFYINKLYNNNLYKKMNKEELKAYHKEYQKVYRQRKKEELKRKRGEKYKNDKFSSDGEDFKPLEEFPGYYIGNFGTVISIKGNDGPKVLSQRQTRHGYQTVMLSLDGYPKSFQVGRLVLQTFVGYPTDPWLCYVHHKDGDLSNCRLDNIVWMICETDYSYNPEISHRRGVLKPDSTRTRMTEAKLNQSPETIKKAIASRRAVLKGRGYWK